MIVKVLKGQFVHPFSNSRELEKGRVRIIHSDKKVNHFFYGQGVCLQCMKESADLVRFERTLKAVANRRRLAIVRFLKTCNSATVSEIADAIGLSFKATSKHLQLLFSVGILEREQKSTLIFYSLSLTPGRVLETVIKVV